MILVLALTMLAPCFYYTFLWNRLRYLWPFATGWITGLACLARVVGDPAGERAGLAGESATPMLCGAFAGVLAIKVEGAIDDVAWSASGIDSAAGHPRTMGRRPLAGRTRASASTTRARSRTSAGGAPSTSWGSRRRGRDGTGWAVWRRGWSSSTWSASASTSLPTHFIVYPEWMALPMVLGESLTEASVSDAGRSILGGETMVAAEADWSELGSGELPWSPRGAAPIDAVDVADLESEAEHSYELLGAAEGEQVAREAPTPGGKMVVDGGRTRRSVEHFVAHLRPGETTRGIVRLEGTPGTSVDVLVEGRPVGAFEVGDEPGWFEAEFTVPPTLAGAHARVELRASGGTITTYHYWFVAT